MAYTKDDVAPHRCVNGIDVPISDDERQAIADAWNVELAKRTQLEADAAREGEIDQDIQTATIGTVDPKTIAQLKAMTKAEFNAWFDANVPVTAQAIYALVRRLTLIIVRRVL